MQVSAVSRENKTIGGIIEIGNDGIEIILKRFWVIENRLIKIYKLRID